MSLISNYFKTLIRAFRRDLFYSLINFLGLAIGLASVFLILIYVQDEMSYDKHFENSENIYRLESHFVIQGKPDEFAITQIPLGPTLKDEYPEIEDFCRFMSAGTIIFDHNESLIQEDSIMIADTVLFTFLSHNVLYGDPEKCLIEPYSMAVSKSMANRYFGRTDVVGETLKTNDEKLLTIKAVFEDLPQNTHMRYNAVFSAVTIAQEMGEERFNDRSANSFWNINLITLVKIKENASMQSVLDKFPGFYEKYMKSIGDQISASFELSATPLAEVHYHTKSLQHDYPTGESKYLYILLSIALFIIIIAGINYMNLATARSTKRFKEVGLRKVTGAHKSLLIRQFLGESVALSFLALILSVFIIVLILPGFNELANKNFDLSLLLNIKSIGFMLLVTILVGLISGLYPSFYLSSLNPVTVLKGSSRSKGSGPGLRAILVVFQFMISSGLIVGSLAVSGQLKYMQNKNLGFEKDNLIYVSIPDTTINKNTEAFKQELEKSPVIEKTAAFMGGPASFLSKNVMRVEGDGGQMEDHAINNYFIEAEYFDLMGFELDTGRFYSRDMGSDNEKAFVINKTAAQEFNWHNDALGKKFQFGIRLDGPPMRDGEIVGVLKDFNYASLHNRIDPLVLILVNDARFLNTIGVRYSEGQEEKALEWIEKTREEFNAYYPFDYSFLSEDLNEMYKEEAIVSRIFKVFTIL
ncbi:MAG: ABC transporter permease, partial [Candidatus Heimdallarchaeota archaeon]